ncbi:MAG TPA: ATP-binding protein [Roseiflexaceae bacterium]|nr:ATP-binding protein [Roseiflexaceae bacterium]
MSLLAQVLPELWEVDRAEAEAALAQIRDLTRGALAEMRALLFELRPAALGEQDLASALRDHATMFERRTGIGVAVLVESGGDVPRPVEQALFRIAQEALANVARHAHAQRVRVQLRAGPPARLEIADDGRGFTASVGGAERFGLVSMRERAAAIGARLEINSAPGQGTSIAVEWPG